MISDEQPIFEPYKNILSYVCCKNLLLRYLFTAMSSLQKDKRSWLITQCFFMFFFYSPPRPRVFITLFVQYYSAICRPLDCTVEDPGRVSNPGQAVLRQPQCYQTKLVHGFESKLLQIL